MPLAFHHQTRASRPFRCFGPISDRHALPYRKHRGGLHDIMTNDVLHGHKVAGLDKTVPHPVEPVGPDIRQRRATVLWTLTLPLVGLVTVVLE